MQSRAGSWPSQPCEGGVCDGNGQPTYFCVHCDSNFCDGCWGAIIQHRPGKRGPDGLPHEKTDLRVVSRLRHILEPSSDPQAQRALHRDDEDTTWFGIGRNASNDPVFQEYGRYAAIMADSLPSERFTRYPQLVSFIGQTGAGKSTLVKMLIDHQEMKLNPMANPGYPSPVVGSVNDNVPTSGDVHLYADPATAFRREPMLYADCEGLEGGENVPIAKASGSTGLPSQKWTSSGNDPHLPKKLRKTAQSSHRDITWANTPEKRKREYAVTELYPRLLYTFSDVVVFVLRNSKTFESTVLNRLVSWASASMEKSLNQPALPHAIIALNATDMSIDQNQWDVTEATKKLMSDIKGAIDRVSEFQNLAHFWRIRGKTVNTMQDLLECYYSSITVVRIPTKGRYMLINEQVGKLHQEITTKCTTAYNTKKKVRMLSNSDDLHIYLQSAFEHFSHSLDAPFNFVEVALKNNPIPLDFRGNILKLAIAIRDHPTVFLTGPQIFYKLSEMVASCVMLDLVRHRLMGTAEQLLEDHYIDYCDDALYDFCDLYWPCSFNNDRGQCVNFRSGHNPKGHQNAKGKILSTGGYLSSFSAEEYADEWREKLKKNLDRIQRDLEERIFGNPRETEESAASDLHLQLMNAFYERLRPADHFVSHSACFCCLRELPNHPLACGHVICTPCSHSYGKSRGKGLIEMMSCPLHTLRTQWADPCAIKVKPALAGVRILCLDGGGMRGITELEVLKAIEAELPRKIPIQKFFDLMVGTSTGGIIALGLGVEGWSVETCIQKFTQLCGSAFTPREFHGIPVLQQLATINHNSKYKTRPLVSALQQSFSDLKLFGGVNENENHPMYVAVTSTTETCEQPIALTNYNRQNYGPDQPDYKFERPDKPMYELKTWEAARATSAAPPFFKPYVNERTGNGYLDGALYHNNPVRVANQERKLLWPDMESSHPDIFLSIGTGCSSETKETTTRHTNQLTSAASLAQMMPPKMEPGKSIANKHKLAQHYKAMLNRVDNILDTERAWTDFQLDISRSEPDAKSRYRRLNPVLVHQPPRLDEVEKLKDLQQEVHKKMHKQRPHIKEVAYQLVASSFFFDKFPTSARLDSNVCSGQILCRFENGSEDLRNFGFYLVKLRTSSFEPYFIIKDTHQNSSEQKHSMSIEVIQNMIMNAKFDLGHLEIPVSEKLANTTIALCLNQGDFFPISGFPRSLMLEGALKLVRSRPSKLQRGGRTHRARIRRPQREKTNSLTNLDELGIDHLKQGRQSTSRGNFLTTLQPSRKLSRHSSLGHQSVSNPESARSASSGASTLVETQLAGDEYAFSPDDVWAYRRRSADEASRPNSTMFSVNLKDNPFPFDDMAVQPRDFIGQADGLNPDNFTVDTPGITIRRSIHNTFELE